ncbi:exo-alpha-sialidase [Dictyobacter kobayashii]|nr:exo-alpha-sialidase [Dictyobacter kobayashii]
MSDDAGATWTNAISSSLVPYSASIASDGTLYVGFNATSGAGAVERYDPATNTATTISPSAGGNGYEVAVDPSNPQRVIVGAGGVSNGNIWRTTNGGSNWDTLNVSVASSKIPWIVNTDEVNFMTSAQLTFDPLVPDKLWFPQGTGVWYATNNTGPTIAWNFYSQGIEETVTTDLVAPPGGAPVSTIYDRQGFYHANVDSYPTQPLVDSAFWGGTSLDYSGGSPNTLVTVQAKNNYYPSLTGRGATSTDGGKTWQLFGSTPTNSVGGNIALSATDTKNLVWLPSTGDFGKGNAPYYSTDGGATWNQSTGISDSADTHWLFWWGSKRALASDKVNNAFYAITFSTGTSSTGSFYTSTDGGKTFVPAANSPACAQSGDCHVYGQIHAAPGYAGNVWSSAAKGGLWYTTDAGQSAWTKVSAVQEARSFGFGKPLPGYSYPAIYMYGKANGDTAYGIYRSADQGATWILLSTAPAGIYDSANVVTGDMNIAGRAYVGFTGNGFVYGDDQNLAREPIPTGLLPAPWQQQDIGSVGKPGAAAFTHNTFTVRGSGKDIGGTADAFHYVYQAFSGDGSIVAHVMDINDTDSEAEAGVMFRENLNANASFADIVITAEHGSIFQQRTSTGAGALHTQEEKARAPYWIKLTRAGSTFTGFISRDGSSWTKVGSATISMSDAIYVGLAVTAHKDTSLHTSRFDHVSLSHP